MANRNSTEAGGGSLSALLGTGEATFAPARHFSTGPITIGVDIGDLDGDGRLDLVLTNAFDDTVSVLQGIGGGDFVPVATYGTGDGPVSIEGAELNGDGRPELATADTGSDTATIFRNTSHPRQRPTTSR